MKETDVVQIMKEELTRNSNRGEAVTQIEIRIIKEIVSRIIRPTLSEEDWALFLKLTKVEPLLYRVYKSDEGSVAALSSPCYFDLLKNLGVALFLHMDRWCSTPEYFRERWSKDALLEMTCSLAVLHDVVLAEHGNEENILFSFEDARLLLDYIKCAELGFAGPEYIRECTKEALIPLTILKAHLDAGPPS